MSMFSRTKGVKLNASLDREYRSIVGKPERLMKYRCGGRVSKIVRAERRMNAIRDLVRSGEMVEVPAGLQSKAAGRVFRNELHDPIGGMFDGKLLVNADWRWEKFLQEPVCQ